MIFCFLELEKYSNVKLNFSHKLVDIDFNSKMLTFQTFVHQLIINYILLKSFNNLLNIFQIKKPARNCETRRGHWV